jgi:CRISPR type III-B/RAMP module-associated protein Cmr5
MPDLTSQTLDQRRANHAWQVVAKVKRLPDDNDKKKFKTQVKKMPARILTSGLGPALAFLEAKKVAPDLLAALAGWLKTFPLTRTVRVEPPDQEHLLVYILNGSSEFLRFATAESLAYLQWVVRFTDAELRDVATDED